jgi:hypothetical protein
LYGCQSDPCGGIFQDVAVFDRPQRCDALHSFVPILYRELFEIDFLGPFREELRKTQELGKDGVLDRLEDPGDVVGSVFGSGPLTRLGGFIDSIAYGISVLEVVPMVGG